MESLRCACLLPPKDAFRGPERKTKSQGPGEAGNILKAKGPEPGPPNSHPSPLPTHPAPFSRERPEFGISAPEVILGSQSGLSFHWFGL